MLNADEIVAQFSSEQIKKAIEILRGCADENRTSQKITP